MPANRQQAQKQKLQPSIAAPSATANHVFANRASFSESPGSASVMEFSLKRVAAQIDYATKNSATQRDSPLISEQAELVNSRTLTADPIETKRRKVRFVKQEPSSSTSIRVGGVGETAQSRDVLLSNEVEEESRSMVICLDASKKRKRDFEDSNEEKRNTSLSAAHESQGRVSASSVPFSFSLRGNGIMGKRDAPARNGPSNINLQENGSSQTRFLKDDTEIDSEEVKMHGTEGRSADSVRAITNRREAYSDDECHNDDDDEDYDDDDDDDDGDDDFIIFDAEIDDSEPDYEEKGRKHRARQSPVFQSIPTSRKTASHLRSYVKKKSERNCEEEEENFEEEGEEEEGEEEEEEEGEEEEGEEGEEEEEEVEEEEVKYRLQRNAEKNAVPHSPGESLEFRFSFRR